MEHFFSPNSSGHLRSDAGQCQIIGGFRCRPYSNFWVDAVKLLGGLYPPNFPPPPRVSAPLHRIEEKPRIIANKTIIITYYFY